MESVADGGSLAVDLEQRTIVDPGGRTVRFEMDPFVRRCLLEGLDSIALTLEREDDIAAFEASHPAPIATTAF